MGRLVKVYLAERHIYTCSFCGTHLTAHTDRLSTGFRGRTGTAWLFRKVVNVSEGQFKDRFMTTGKHTIVDIFCNDCGTNLGWKYVEAEEAFQRYKKGKFILELQLIIKVEMDSFGIERKLHPNRMDQADEE